MMNSERFQLWTALTFFSIVNLISHHAELADKAEDRDKEDRWILSVSSISMMIGFLACFSHLIWKDWFSGSNLEGWFILIALGFWCAGLPALLEPENEFAVKYVGATRNPLFDATGEGDTVHYWKTPPRKLIIVHANIFFSCWAAFSVALFLGIRHCQEAYQKNDSMITHWTCLFTANFVVMASASRIWKYEDCAEDDYDDDLADSHFEKFCNRSLFAAFLGLLSGLSGVVICYLRLKIVDQIGSMLSLVAWCCAAVYVTYTYADVGPYENTGPGKDPGTLYFATWACVIISLKMASKLLIEIAVSEGAKEDPEVELGNISTKGGPAVKGPLEFEDAQEDEEVEEVEVVGVHA